jgi:hypothetical protein
MIRHLKSTSIHRLDDQTKLFEFLCKLSLINLFLTWTYNFKQQMGSRPYSRKRRKQNGGEVFKEQYILYV